MDMCFLLIQFGKVRKKAASAAQLFLIQDRLQLVCMAIVFLGLSTYNPASPQ